MSRIGKKGEGRIQLLIAEFLDAMDMDPDGMQRVDIEAVARTAYGLPRGERPLRWQEIAVYRAARSAGVERLNGYLQRPHPDCGKKSTAHKSPIR
jgi:hypothetical protein